jgi:hypothetical protein
MFDIDFDSILIDNLVSSTLVNVSDRFERDGRQGMHGRHRNGLLLVPDGPGHFAERRPAGRHQVVDGPVSSTLLDYCLLHHDARHPIFRKGII